MANEGRYGRDDERGAWDRTRDEVRSWFGDEEADRRRDMDDRRSERGGRSDEDERWTGGGAAPEGAGYAGAGYGGLSSSPAGAGSTYDADFAGTPRWDRADPGHTGTHGAHPVASVPGSNYSNFSPFGGFGSSARARAIIGQQGRGGGRRSGSRNAIGGGWSRPEDAHYAEYRQRQIEKLDREYDEYCRDCQNRFEEDFGTWRSSRRGSGGEPQS